MKKTPCAAMLSFFLLSGSDVGECLGYIVQNGQKDENSRFFLLNEDTDCNYLVILETEGKMTQPSFMRAIDTQTKEITTPDYIQDLEYEFWKSNQQEANICESSPEQHAADN